MHKRRKAGCKGLRGLRGFCLHRCLCPLVGTGLAERRQAARPAGEYQRRRLSLEQQEALEQLPGWVWSVNEARWIEGFKYLREYVEREGYAQVPQQYVTEDGYKLGTWVRDQRYEYRKGRLSVDQQVALEQLPGWEWSLQNSRGKSKV